MTGKQQRRLVATVHVGGKRYGPGDEVPDEVAEQITNPNVWASDGDGSDGSATGSAGGGRRRGDGPQLASFVHVGGRRFGPGDDVPPEVAKQITNPKAWEGGKLPDFADGQDEPDDGSGQPESGGGKSGGSEEPGDNGDGDGDGGNPGEPASPATPRVPAPPRSGPGSGKDAWEAWANTQGLTYPKGAAKADIIGAAEQAGLIDADAK